jgi:homoserine acetyltransferase
VLTKKLGVQKIFCVVGFSMGGQQVDLLILFKYGHILITVGISLGHHVPGPSGKVFHTITIVSFAYP